MVDGKPHVARNLSAQLMKIERGDETVDCMWYWFRSLYKGMVLRCPLPIGNIKSSSETEQGLG